MDYPTFLFQSHNASNAPSRETILDDYNELKCIWLKDLNEQEEEDQPTDKSAPEKPFTLTLSEYDNHTEKMFRMMLGNEITIDSEITLSMIQKRFEELIESLDILASNLRVCGLLSGQETPVENTMQSIRGVSENYLYYLYRIREVMDFTYECIIATIRMRFSCVSNKTLKEFQNHPRVVDAKMTYKKYTERQTLLTRLINWFNLKGYVYKRSESPQHQGPKYTLLYRPIMSEMGYLTHAYEPMKSDDGKPMTLDTWVQLQCKSGPNRLLAESAGLDWVSTMMTKNYMYDIPIYQPNRFVMSFNDGIYFVNVQQALLDTGSTKMHPNTKYTDHFIPYGTKEHKKLSRKFIAIRYFDRSYVGGGYENEMHISTPHFDKILKYQWGERHDYAEIYESMAMCIGNTLYPIGAVNNWTRSFYLLGKSKCGKSLIINNILMKLYGPEYTMIISNQIQKNFGWNDIRGKYLALATEVDYNFQMDEAELKSALSGEYVAIREKFNPFTVPEEIKTHIILAGNSKPNFKDKSSAMSRRLLVFYFGNPVNEEERDTYLESKLELELPYIIIKCNRIFLRKLLESDRTHIVPSINYHVETDQMCELMDNSLLSFLIDNENTESESNTLVFAHRSRCTLNDFLKAYNDYCRASNKSRIDIRNRVSLDSTIERYASMGRNPLRIIDENNQRYIQGIEILRRDPHTTNISYA